LRVVGKDKAGGLGIAFQIVAAIETTEELLLEGALKYVAADFQLDGVALHQTQGS